MDLRTNIRQFCALLVFLISFIGVGHAAETTALMTTNTMIPTTFQTIFPMTSTMAPTMAPTIIHLVPVMISNNNNIGNVSGTGRSSIISSSSSHTQLSPNATLLTRKTLSSVFASPSTGPDISDRTFSVFGGISRNPPGIVPKVTAYFGTQLKSAKDPSPVYAPPPPPPRKHKKRKKKGRYSYGRPNSYGRPSNGYPSQSYGNPSSSYGTPLGQPLSFYDPQSQNQGGGYSSGPRYEPSPGGYSSPGNPAVQPSGGYPLASYDRPNNNQQFQNQGQGNSGNFNNNNNNFNNVPGLVPPPISLQAPIDPQNSNSVMGAPPQSFGNGFNNQQLNSGTFSNQFLNSSQNGQVVDNFQQQQQQTNFNNNGNSQMTGVAYQPAQPIQQQQMFPSNQQIPQQLVFNANQQQQNIQQQQPQVTNQQFSNNQQQQPVFNTNQQQFANNNQQQNLNNLQFVNNPQQQQTVFPTQQLQNNQQQNFVSTFPNNQQQQQTFQPQGYSSQQQPVFTTTQFVNQQQQQQQPVFTNTLFSSQQQQPVFTNTLFSSQQQQPVFTNTQFSTQQQQPVFTNTQFSIQPQQQQTIFSPQVIPIPAAIIPQQQQQIFQQPIDSTPRTIFVGTPQPQSNPNHFKFVFISPPQVQTLPMTATSAILSPQQKPAEDVFYVVRKKPVDSVQPSLSFSIPKEETSGAGGYGWSKPDVPSFSARYKSSFAQSLSNSPFGDAMHTAYSQPSTSSAIGSSRARSLSRSSADNPWKPIVKQEKSLRVPESESIRVGLQSALTNAFKAISDTDYNY